MSENLSSAEAEIIARKVADEVVNKLNCTEHNKLIHENREVLRNGLQDDVKQIRQDVNKLRSFLWTAIILSGLAVMGIFSDILTHIK